MNFLEKPNLEKNEENKETNDWYKMGFERAEKEAEFEMNRLFFKRKTCERCRGSLDSGRTQSMFNIQTICLWCQEVEELHPDYEKAVKEVKIAVRKNDSRFCGIGVDLDELKKIEEGC